MSKTLVMEDKKAFDADRWYQTHHDEVSKDVREMDLGSLDLQKVKQRLWELSGRLAYWGNAMSHLTDEIQALKDRYDMWYATKYSEVDSAAPRRTEGYKKSQVMVLYSDLVRKYYQKLRKLESLYNRISSLHKSYRIQSDDLRTLATVLKSELFSNIGGGLHTLD